MSHMSELKVVYTAPYDSSTLPNCREFTAVVATVGVGNVSQLTCDLLVNNLDLRLVANLDFKFIPAVVGYDPYSNPNNVRKPDLMTCSQMYANDDRKLVVLQFRAPPFPGCRKRHITELVLFLRSSGFARIIVLSSSFAMQRKDAELMESQLRYAVTDNFNISDRQLLITKKWPALIPHTEEIQESSVKSSSKTTYYLPGSGIASHLFDECNGSDGLPVCLLNCFASEGDNAGDAWYVVKMLTDWLGLLPESKHILHPHHVWRAPPSWSMLYGNDTSACLY